MREFLRGTPLDGRLRWIRCDEQRRLGAKRNAAARRAKECPPTAAPPAAGGSGMGAASCARRMVLEARRAFAAVVRPDAVGAALEAKAVTEGAVVPLDFSLDAPCGRSARFVAVVAPESGRVRPADAVDLSFASFDDLAKGAMRIAAETVGALEKALGLLVYEPPEVDGMVSMKVAVEATGGDATVT